MSDDVVRLVDGTIETGQPTAVRNQLITQARKLLREGINAEVIRRALVEWENRPGISPALIPHLVSDIIRRQRATADAEAAIASKRDWESQLQEELGG